MTEVAARPADPSQVHPDRLIALVADRQHGVVLREQLAALGLKRGAIAHRRERGLLVRLHDGVYLWGQITPSLRARGFAGAAASGTGAFVSHAWGLMLWKLRPPTDSWVDVTVVGRRVRVPGICGHEGELSRQELAAAVEKAQIKRLVTKPQLADVIRQAPRRAGVAALRALLDEPAFTRSQAERRLVALLRAAGLPRPVFNAWAEGFEVDVLWREERVVLEFDSYAFHATRAAFERDRRRTAALTHGRYLVLRTTWRELEVESYALVARTAEALARRQAARRANDARPLSSPRPHTPAAGQ